MKTLLATTLVLALALTGCTVAYNTQYVGESPSNTPESKVMSDAIGEEVTVSYNTGEAVRGLLLTAAPDSLHIEMQAGTLAVRRAGIAQLKTGGSVAGSIVGCVLGLTGGIFLGGALGAELGSAGKKGWDEFGGFLEGGMLGIVVGGVAGGWAGTVIGRKAGAGTIYVWPSE